MKTLINLFLGLALSFFLPMLAPAQSIEWQKLNEEVTALYKKGKYNQATALAKKTLDVAEKEASNPFVIATSLHNLGSLYIMQGHYAQAEPLLKRSLAIREKVQGLDHPDVAMSLDNLAALYAAQSRYAQAEPFFKRSLTIREKVLGPDHLDVATNMDKLAALYFHQGQYEKAVSFSERSLAIQEKVLAPDHLDVATNLDKLAVLYATQSQHEKAEPFSMRSLAIREKVLGPDHPDTAASLNNLAELYRNQGQYEKAEPFYKRSLAIREKVLGPDHPDTATSLNNLAELYRKHGQYEQAEQLSKRSLAIREKVLGLDHPVVAMSLDHLSALYEAQGQYEKAEAFSKRSLAIREKVLGPDHVDIAISLNNLAAVYRTQGQYEKAEPLYKRSLAIREKVLGPDHVDIAISLNNLAALYEAQGQYEKAEAFSKRSQAIWEKVLGPDHPHMATSLNNLATLYTIQGEYEKAEFLSKRSLTIQEKALGPTHPDIAASLDNLAELYRIQGQYEKAEPLYKRSQAIREKVLGREHPKVAISLNNLAEFYKTQGQYEKVEPLYKRALEVQEKVLGPDHPNVATILNNLAALYTAQGQYEKAEAFSKRSLAVREKALGADHSHVASSLSNLAEVYKTQGQYEKAEPLYKRALEVQEKALGPDHPGMAAGLSNLALSLWADGKIGQAIELLRRANAISEHHLRMLLAKGSEYEKRAYMATINSDVDARISLDQAPAARSPGSTQLALTTLLQRKGRVLDALAGSFADLRRRLSVENVELLDQLSLVNGKRAALYLHATQTKIAPEQYHAEMTHLETETEALEARISTSSAEFRALAQPITLEGVQQAIPSGAALVEFAVYRPFNPEAKTPGERWGLARYVAYVLRPKGDPVSVDVGEARIIERLVGDLRQGLANPSSQFVTRMARKLDEQVMRPVRRLLDDTRTVLLSPDGSLNLVPFGALVDEENQYLVKRYAFTYLSSGRDLLRLQAKVTSRYPGTIMAEVDFGSPRKATQAAQAEPGGAKRRSVDFAAGGFLPLPGTAAEAHAIAKIFPTLKILSGKQATESALKQLHGPQILHVATHGFFLPLLREEPSDESSPQVAHTSSIRAPRTENPLLRSGLALANANQLDSEGEDGVLTALEAAGLDLWGTRLVVLSACETGIGEVQNGEGVFGLRRSLVIAGSESQVMSLWKVNDAATKDLMVDYYTHLISNKGRSEALRQAQLTMLNDQNHSHPFYWASFIPSGNWTRLEWSVAEDKLQ